MRRFVSLMLALALAGAITITLASCTGGEAEEDATKNSTIVEDPVEGDENETAKQPEESDDKDWGMGEVPLN